MEHHKDDSPTETDKYDDFEMSPWDAEFVSTIDKDTFFKLMMAANFLDIQGLLDLLSRIIADNMESKTVEEIRNEYDIENDLSDSEIEKMINESQWSTEE